MTSKVRFGILPHSCVGVWSGSSHTVLVVDARAFQNPVYGTVRHWRTTHHDAAERLVHRRLQHHLCLTNDPALAELFYVPFYPGERNCRDCAW